MQYFAVPAVSNEAGSAHDGTTTLPTTPFETFVFGRGLVERDRRGRRDRWRQLPHRLSRRQRRMCPALECHPLGLAQ